jgi:hypothetical protein
MSSHQLPQWNDGMALVVAFAPSVDIVTCLNAQAARRL